MKCCGETFLYRCKWPLNISDEYTVFHLFVPLLPLRSFQFYSMKQVNNKHLVYLPFSIFGVLSLGFTQGCEHFYDSPDIKHQITS